MRATISLFILSILVTMSCSQNNPISPATTGPEGHVATSASGSVVWGFYDFTIDPDSETISSIQLRTCEFAANVLRFMQPPKSPTNNVTASIEAGSDISSGHLFVKVALKHPFPGVTSFTGFDVRGVIVGNGSVPGLADSSILYAGTNDLRLLNADGFTRWFNPTEFATYETLFGFVQGISGVPSYDWTAILNGYKFYCDGLGKEDDPVTFFSNPLCSNPRGVFSVSSSNERTFELQFPMSGGGPELSFQYAVLASWQAPYPSPPVDIPDDFPISANCPEVFCIHTEDLGDLYYEDSTHKGGSLILKVRAFDHQGSVSPQGIPGEVSTIHLETPGGIIAPDGLATYDAASLAGLLIAQDSVSATWQFTINDVNLTGSGTFPIVIVIESADPTDYNSGIPGFAYPTSAHLSAYSLGWITVSDKAPTVYKDPVAVAEVTSQPPYCPGVSVEFDGSASHDQDEYGQQIVSWDWEFNTDGLFDAAHGPNVEWTFDEMGFYPVQIRVTDDEGATDILDEPLTVTVGTPSWVDDSADPMQSNGSFEHPWITIQDGIINARTDCGHRWVLVKDGVYYGKINIGDETTLEGWSDPAPLLTTEDNSTQPMVHFAGAMNSTLNHFRAQPKCVHDYDAGVYTDAIFISLGSNNVLIEDVEFIDNPGGETCSRIIDGGDGIEAMTVRNVRVNGYHVEARGLVNISGDDSIIEDCVFLNISHTTETHFYVIAAIDSKNLLVARNVIGHVCYSELFDKAPGMGGIYTYLSTGLIQNNLVFDINAITSGNSGLCYGINADGVTDLIIEHNTVTRLHTPIAAVGIQVTNVDGEPGTIIFRDQISGNLDASGSSVNWRFSYGGAFLDGGPSVPVDYSCSWNVFSAFVPNQQVVEGVGMVYTDPMFMDPDNDDFRLNPLSPCIGTAHDSTDIGAYGGNNPLTWIP